MTMCIYWLREKISSTMPRLYEAQPWHLRKLLIYNIILSVGIIYICVKESLQVKY